MKKNTIYWIIGVVLGIALILWLVSLLNKNGKTNGTGTGLRRYAVGGGIGPDAPPSAPRPVPTPMPAPVRPIQYPYNPKNPVIQQYFCSTYDKSTGKCNRCIRNNSDGSQTVIIESSDASSEWMRNCANL